LKMVFKATSDAPTPVNLCNHAYWNLSGGLKASIKAHVLQLNTPFFLPVDATQIPVGVTAPVAGTPMDFTVPTPVGARITDVDGGGEPGYHRMVSALMSSYRLPVLSCAVAFLCGGLSACASDDPAWSYRNAPGSPLVMGMPPYGRLGADTKPPSGYVAFCQRKVSVCKPAEGPAQIALTDMVWRELQEVNLMVNRTLVSVDDQKHYGTQEYWTIPEDGLGDCEDYVLTKREALIKLGVPQSALRITVVFAPHFVRHAVLTVVTDEGDFVLDNLRNEIVTWDKTTYTYLERQDPLSASGWTSLQ